MTRTIDEMIYDTKNTVMNKLARYIIKHTPILYSTTIYEVLNKVGTNEELDFYVEQVKHLRKRNTF